MLEAIGNFYHGDFASLLRGAADQPLGSSNDIVQRHQISAGEPTIGEIENHIGARVSHDPEVVSGTSSSGFDRRNPVARALQAPHQ